MFISNRTLNRYIPIIYLTHRYDIQFARLVLSPSSTRTFSSIVHPVSERGMWLIFWVIKESDV